MAEPLHTPPQLRPWLKSGLSFLLMDSAEAVKAHALTRSPRAQSAALPPEAGHSGRAVRTGPGRTAETVSKERANRQIPTQAHVSGTAPLQDVSAARQFSGPPSSVSANPASPVPRGMAGSPDGKKPLPPGEWPQAWQALFRRRPLPPRPMVFWTYNGLGDDLMGQAVEERQKIIVRMLKALGHPPGTHVFWPFRLPDENGQERGSLFWSGENLMKPRFLLVYGQDAAQGVGLANVARLYRAETWQGRRVVLLPSPLELADDGVYGRSFIFLSRQLNFCSGSGRNGERG